MKAVDETIAKELAKLFTNGITERRIPKTWKEANGDICSRKGTEETSITTEQFACYQICTQLFTKITTTRLKKKLDENQPREQT